MKRVVVLLALLITAAGYVYLQTTSSRSPLPGLMPAGALVYLEAHDFGRLLREWNQSQVKGDWLASSNYEQFSRSNLFEKLGGVYQQYGAAAGFLPDLSGLLGVAGAESALALYEIREVEFLYISRVGEAQLARSQLWALRDKFERRQAGGNAFYLRTDPGSRRTVAFAFAGGYLFVATRDDLVARALALLAGGADPSLASEPWVQAATAAASAPGELRLLMKLQSLVDSVHFRSYWIQRNTPAVRPYWTAIADLARSRTALTETRVFLRRDESPGAPQASVAALVALVPPSAGMYKTLRVQSPKDAAALVVHKLIAPPMDRVDDWRFAQAAVSPDDPTGTEGDLETRIDEPPLPADAGVSDSVAAVEDLVTKAGVQSALLVQSSVAAGGPFLRTPAVIVLAGAGSWDLAAARATLSVAAGALWTTSGAGAGWTIAAAAPQPVERLNGLGTLLMASRGNLLFLANDANLLTATLTRTAAPPTAERMTYAAGFRHMRERARFERLMTALDAHTASSRFFRFGNNAAPFFSGNLASLSRSLASVAEVRITEQVEGPVTKQVVVYSLAP